MASIAFDQALFRFSSVRTRLTWGHRKVSIRYTIRLDRHQGSVFQTARNGYQHRGGIEPEKAAALVSKIFTDWKRDLYSHSKFAGFFRKSQNPKKEALHTNSRFRKRVSWIRSLAASHRSENLRSISRLAWKLLFGRIRNDGQYRQSCS